MTVKRCGSCGNYSDVGYEACRVCGVNNAFYRVDSYDLLVDISNKLSKIIKLLGENNKK